MPGAAGLGRGARNAAPPDFAASTSCAMTRPCGPVPAMRATSRPAALARRRASGEAKMRPRPLAAGAGATGGAGIATLCAGGGDGGGAAAGFDAPAGGLGATCFTAGALATAVFTSSPSAASTAIGALTATSAVPSGTRIFAITPSSIASYSMVALSVSISARMSPALTLSPSFLSHLAMLPFSMVGDSAGIRMLIGIDAPLAFGTPALAARNGFGGGFGFGPRLNPRLGARSRGFRRFSAFLALRRTPGRPARHARPQPAERVRDCVGDGGGHLGFGELTVRCVKRCKPARNIGKHQTPGARPRENITARHDEKLFINHGRAQ